jgi:SAM-dependent methyltransferase
MASAREIKEAVKARYTAVAESRNTGCGAATAAVAVAARRQLLLRWWRPQGSRHDLAQRQGAGGDTRCEAILGLGCGSCRLCGFKAGETVLDLGSGGHRRLLSPRRRSALMGKVYGVDMNESMIRRAKEAAEEYGFKNVEFRLGEIEQMPIDDATIDAIISNCVINLSPDKAQVFREAHRVLKPGGRITVSDIVTEGRIPEEIRKDLDSWASCVSGAPGRSTSRTSRAGFKTPRYSRESFMTQATRCRLQVRASQSRPTSLNNHYFCDTTLSTLWTRRRCVHVLLQLIEVDAVPLDGHLEALRPLIDLLKADVNLH